MEENLVVILRDRIEGAIMLDAQCIQKIVPDEPSSTILITTMRIQEKNPTILPFHILKNKPARLAELLERLCCLGGREEGGQTTTDEALLTVFEAFSRVTRFYKNSASMQKEISKQ